MEDTLVYGPSFKLAKTAPYIFNRRTCTFHPQGRNSYRLNVGVKLIRIAIAGHDWRDPSAFRILCDLANTDIIAGRGLRPIGGPWLFSSRMRTLAGGPILEDIEMYFRVHELFTRCTSAESRESDYAEGFANYWEHVVNLAHANVDDCFFA